MKHDLQVTKAAWESLHPGLYRYNSPQQIDSLFDDAHSRITNIRSRKDFFILLSQLNIQLRCGHSFVSYYNQPESIEEEIFPKRFLPLLFKVINGEFIITHNLSDHENIRAGDEILSINGITNKRITDSFLTVSKADGRNGLAKKLDNISIYPNDIGNTKHTLTDIFFPLFFKPGDETSYKLQIRNQEGRSTEYVIPLTTKSQRQDLYNAKYGQLPVKEKTWNLTKVNNETCILKLGDFAVYNWKFNFKNWLDSTFVSIKKEKFKNLIIDIRQNEGGSDDVRDEVLSYIIQYPVSCHNSHKRFYKYLSIPDSLQPYLKTWDKSFRKPKDSSMFQPSDGLYLEKASIEKCDTLYPKQNRFKGQIFLMTDVTNSSSTFLMADIIKKGNFATIVGEKTGGSRQGINGGQYFFLNLPGSKIEMDVPLVYQTTGTTNPDEGISPDYEVVTTARDIRLKKDAQVNFILKSLVRKK